jgi:hypothetical protein
MKGATMTNLPLNHAKQQRHRSAMTSALKDRDTARDEIFIWLRGLSPEERAKVSPDKFARLSAEQFAILLGRPLSKASFDHAYHDAVATLEMPGRFDRLRFWSRRSQRTKVIKIRPPLHHALHWTGIACLCSGLASISVVAALPYVPSLTSPPIRSMDASTWPQCGRLSPETDGCVYFVESGLTWPDAAHWLDMPLPLLLKANQSNGTVPLAKGAPLIVWRFRRPLSP